MKTIFKDLRMEMQKPLKKILQSVSPWLRPLLMKYKDYPKAIGWPINAISWGVNAALALPLIPIIGLLLIIGLPTFILHLITTGIINALTHGAYYTKKQAYETTGIIPISPSIHLTLLLKSSFSTLTQPLPQNPLGKLGQFLLRPSLLILMLPLLAIAATITFTRYVLMSIMTATLICVLCLKTTSLVILNLPLYLIDAFLFIRKGAKPRVNTPDLSATAPIVTHLEAEALPTAFVATPQQPVHVKDSVNAVANPNAAHEPSFERSSRSAISPELSHKDSVVRQPSFFGSSLHALAISAEKRRAFESFPPPFIAELD